MTMNVNSLTPITLTSLRRETGALLKLAVCAGLNREKSRSNWPAADPSRAWVRNFLRAESPLPPAVALTREPLP